MRVTPIGHARTPFPTKFGVPRQASLADRVPSCLFVDAEVLGEGEADALCALGEGSWVWALWGFDLCAPGDDAAFSPTVRPPRLGGSERVGVFASRSNFRANPIALSALRVTARPQCICAGVAAGGTDVEGARRVAMEDGVPVGVGRPAAEGGASCAASEAIASGGEGQSATDDIAAVREIRIPVAGADMVDGSPLFAVWAYDPSRDAVGGARGGWAAGRTWEKLDVEDITDETLAPLAPELREGLLQVLALDPRPAWTRGCDADREFWLPFADIEVYFSVSGTTLTVTRVCPAGPRGR